MLDRRWRYRLPLWVALVTLVVLILRHPVNISPSMSSIQTLAIFQSLPQFAGLFLSCIGILFFLLFKDHKDTKNYERIPLICLFALVFVGFWIIKTPYGAGGDGFWNMAQAVNLNIPSNIVAWFVKQSGIHILASGIYRVSHLDMFTIAQIFRIMTLLLFAVATYWFCRNALKDTRLAIIATLVIAVVAGVLSPGGALVRTTFRPDLLGGVLWMTAMALIFKDDMPLRNRRDLALVIVLVVLTAITYSVHALVLAFALLGIFLFDKIAKKSTIPLVVVIIAMVAIAPFMMFRTRISFGVLSEVMPRITENVRGESLAPPTPLVEVSPSAGQALRETQATQYPGVFSFFLSSLHTGVYDPLPWWAGFAKYLKWAFLGFGTILAVIGLVRVRKRETIPRRLVGAVWGLLAMSGILAAASYQGYEYQRYLLYSPLFLAPIIVRFFADRWRWGTRIMIVGLLVLALPSFLSLDSSWIGLDRVNEQEVEAGEFLRERYDDGGELQIFTNHPFGFYVANYYTPKAKQCGTQTIFWTPNKEILSENLDALVEAYNECEGSCIFISSEKIIYSWGLVLSIEPDDYVWRDLRQELGEPIFSNEYVKVYENE